MIKISNLNFEYDRAPILENINATIEKGSLCALYGPNGSGKSTLLKCCLGMLKYRTGQILVNGQDISKMNDIDISRIISYVPQRHQHSFSYTAFEVVLMGRHPHISNFLGPTKDDIELTKEVLDKMGIKHLSNRPYNELSGGELQLVLLARALNQDTPVMLLDEPSSALDYHNQIIIWEKLSSLSNNGKTIIVTTHDPNQVLWYCDQAIILNKTVIDIGKSSDVINSKNIGRLYGDIVNIEECKGVKIVVPKKTFNGV
jgi:iron complex transport system ATP-binding protein